MNKGSLFNYSRNHFGTEPEYFWSKFPSGAVLRPRNGGKGFALIMRVSGIKEGLRTEEGVDIVRLKAKPEHAGFLGHLS